MAGGRGDLTLWLGDVGLFAAFIESLGLPKALAARLKRVAGRPRLLNAELARAGEAAPAAGGGQLAAVGRHRRVVTARGDIGQHLRSPSALHRLHRRVA